MEFEEDRQKMRAGDLKVEREFGEGSVDFRGAADRVSLEEAAGFLLAHCQVIREMETVPLPGWTGRGWTRSWTAQAGFWRRT